MCTSTSVYHVSFCAWWTFTIESQHEVIQVRQCIYLFVPHISSCLQFFQSNFCVTRANQISSYFQYSIAKYKWPAFDIRVNVVSVNVPFTV